MKIVTFLVFLLLIVINGYAQVFDTLVLQPIEAKYDTSRISDVSDKLAIYAGFSGKIHNIILKNENTDKELALEPNGKSSISFGFGYKWLGFGLSFNPGFMNKDDNIYGRTESFDTQLNIYSKFIGFDAYLQYYKGFYIENPEDFTNWQYDFFPLRPDLESFSFGLSAYYFSNSKHFSYKAAFSRNQIQKRSAGAFIAGINFSENIVLAPGSFLPKELPDSLKPYYNIDAFITYSLGVSIGYTRTFVFLKRFFINLSIVPGFGFRNAKYAVDGLITEIVPTITGSLTSRFSLGYEGKRLYAGFTFVNLVDSYNYKSINISSATGNSQLFIGKRFDVSKLKWRKR